MDKFSNKMEDSVNDFVTMEDDLFREKYFIILDIIVQSLSIKSEHTYKILGHVLNELSEKIGYQNMNIYLDKLFQSIEFNNFIIDCARYGYIHLIRLCRSRISSKIHNDLAVQIINCTTKENRLAVIQELEITQYDRLAGLAATNNCLDILKYLWPNVKDKCRVLASAARYNHNSLFEWAYQNCELDKISYDRIADAASESGNVEILKWSILKGANNFLSYERNALAEKNMDIVTLLRNIKHEN